MTAYEIADLRAQTSSRLSMVVTGHSTLTLAVFAAAFAAGAKLDTTSIVALILFLLIATASTLNLINVAYAQLRALAVDADRLEEVDRERPAILRAKLVLPAPGIAPLANGLLTASNIGFIWYILKVSGHLG